MNQSDLERLRSIKTFPSLVKYLRDELDWPIDSDNVDDVMFDYEPDELGLDAKTAVNIKEIKQLRPLTTKQPWGIFFINFEPKHLPVVVLRRVLRALVIKKRQSANKPHQAAWNLHDLLFISSYGESAGRSISFAHFTESEETGDLPSLRVLGWDDQDTVLHLDHAHATLKEKLRWPDEEENLDTWRTTWSSAFTVGYRQVITNSKELAARMAGLATQIRKRANAVLAIESERGPFRKLHEAFKESLVHDLSEDDFADMYAQTITYGLLTAKFSRPAGLVAANLVDMIPPTNPFLKDLLATFLSIGGRKGKIDFDELGINEVVELLRNTDTEAIKRDFGNLNPDEDPVIRFYEDFLKQYDAKKRMQRGVFFTPVPVVSFIVRSVHEILQTEFGLEDGLADTTTWGEMAERLEKHRHGEPFAGAQDKLRRTMSSASGDVQGTPFDSAQGDGGFKIPDGVSPDEPFVLILDIAAGTGTFMVMVIEVIYQTMTAKWRKQGKMELEMPGLWDEYVPEHLLPRLYGFELMMAPYAIAHMKIGLKLSETGYRFRSNERLHLYLTNTLEPPHDFSGQLEFMAPALAHEAEAVNEVKRKKKFTVLMGNPPYSKMSSNLSEDAVRLVEPFRFVDGERIIEKGALAHELNLQDDYVKFFGFMLESLRRVPIGIGSYISNFRFLDSRSLRGMRKMMLDKTSSSIFINLGGHSANSRDSDCQDENVFEIEQGVAISILTKRGSEKERVTQYRRLYGDRVEKYNFLAKGKPHTVGLMPIQVTPPLYKFTDEADGSGGEFLNWMSLEEILPFNSGSIITSRDNLAINFDARQLHANVRAFANSPMGDNKIRERIGFSVKEKWDDELCKRKLRQEDVPKEYIKPILYRPFDIRQIYYYIPLLDTPSRPVCNAIYGLSNLVLLTPKVKTTSTFTHALVSRVPSEKKAASHDRATQMFPLWFKPDKTALLQEEDRLIPNLNKQWLAAFLTATGKDRLEEECLFRFIYAILYSQSYRTRYGVSLRDDFPRIPVISDSQLFEQLVGLGGDLLGLHLLEDDYDGASWNISKCKNPLKHPITKFVGKELEVEKVTYSNNTVWIDKAQTSGFKGVPENVWEFHIGGYQVCEKWLKDRKGRTLSKEDIEHYHRIVVALNETIRLMSEIDKVIDEHGGWPIK